MKEYKIDGKKINIAEEDWDFLIVLDACRYDTFLEVYRDILGDVGELKKAISPASWTMEWLNKQFSGRYDDVIYVSANPYINSGKEITHHGLSYDGREHFSKVIDVWKDWDEKLGTVPPVNVNKKFHTTYMKNPDKRFILHYLQPHRPYISLGGGESTLLEAKNKLEGDEKADDEKTFSKTVGGALTEIQAWNLKKLLKKEPSSTEEEFYRKHGKKGMKEIYKLEVELVLKYVKMLVESISGKWIITADHGERICSFWDHYSHNGRHDRAVTEVPYLVIDTTKKSK